MLSPEPQLTASHKAFRPAPSSLGKTAEEVSENETALEEVPTTSDLNGIFLRDRTSLCHVKPGTPAFCAVKHALLQSRRG